MQNYKKYNIIKLLGDIKMIVYNALKYEFDNDVERNEISDKIYNKIRELGLSGGQDSEYMAWQNSLNFMKMF